MNITFIVGPEESFKEKVFSDKVHDVYVNYPLDRIFAYDKQTTLKSPISLFDTKPYWGKLERVEKVIQNSEEQTDQLIITGWHLPELLTDLIKLYPDATFVLVRGWSGEIDRTMLQQELLVIDLATRNQIIAKQNKAISQSISDCNLDLTWTRVSDLKSVRIFDKGEIVPNDDGKIEIATFKGTDCNFGQ
jgi:hypothetical protein